MPARWAMHGAGMLIQRTDVSYLQDLRSVAHSRLYACGSRVRLVVYVRTFAQNAFACGSMVLCRYCVSFFALRGQKMIHKGLNLTDKRKFCLCFVFSLCEQKK